MEVTWIVWSTLSVAAVGLAQGILHVIIVGTKDESDSLFYF